MAVLLPNSDSHSRLLPRGDERISNRGVNVIPTTEDLNSLPKGGSKLKSLMSTGPMSEFVMHELRDTLYQLLWALLCSSADIQ